MKELFKGVTKNDLLKLKDSKAVPITAHSHEVVVPVVYATRVKEFMRKEGMRVPLKPEELQTLKQKAKQTEGEMEAYAKGGTIKLKKVRAKKIKINKDVVKKGNVKQIVNIKLGEKVIRRPSTRAKAISKDMIPIRPGVSTFPISNQPSYERMIPSSGATTNIPLPTTSNVASVSSLVKPQAMPATVKPTVTDVLRRSSVAREAAKVARQKGLPPGAVRDATGRIFTTYSPEGQLQPMTASMMESLKGKPKPPPPPPPRGAPGF
jgi:hypothetical protein